MPGSANPPCAARRHIPEVQNKAQTVVELKACPTFIVGKPVVQAFVPRVENPAVAVEKTRLLLELVMERMAVDVPVAIDGCRKDHSRTGLPTQTPQ